MKVGPLLGMFLAIAAVVGTTGSALADHRRDRGDRDWVDEYREGPCRVREVSDDGDYQKVIRCPDGRGKTWRRGRWERDFRDGPCRVRIEASREVYRKEVTCRGRDYD